MQENENHAALVHLFMTEFLVNKFKKYTDADVYPIVFGGIDVTRCASGEGTTSDIDVRFVVTARVESNNDHHVQKAERVRDAFVKEIFDHAVTRVGPMTTLTISETYRTAKFLRVCIYAEHATIGEKQVVLDTAIFSNYSGSHYEGFRNFFDEPKHPIPIYVDHKTNIQYATCDWLIVDNARMLYESIEGLKSSQGTGKTKQLAYWQEHYTKYISKMALMYKHLNKVNDAKRIEILDKIYASAKADDMVTLIKITNVKSIVTKFTDSPNYNNAYNAIVTYILKSVLGKYMKRNITEYSYPVVLGGTDVSRCVEKMFKILVKDIDIHFIVTDKDADAEEDAIRNRAKMLNDMLSDRGLNNKLNQLSSKYGMDISIKLVNTWKPSSIPFIKKFVMLKVEFANVLNKSLLKSINLMDISLHVQPDHEYSKYLTIINKHQTKATVRNPVPYTIAKSGVVYASCNFTFFNTIQMYKMYKSVYDKSSDSNMMARYLKYMMKFTALYMVLMNPSKELTHKLRSAYKKAQDLIKGLDIRETISVLALDHVVSKMETLTDYENVVKYVDGANRD